MKVTSNSGPLIWLAKYNKLKILKTLYNTIYIPKSVYIETVKIGLLKGYKDAEIIDKAIKDNWIIIRNTSQNSIIKVMNIENKFKIKLGKSEREAIALALDLKESILLTNDQQAYIIAKMLNIKAKGILYILLKSVKERILNKKEAWNLLKNMVNNGFWLSPTLIIKFKEILINI